MGVTLTAKMKWKAREAREGGDRQEVRLTDLKKNYKSGLLLLFFKIHFILRFHPKVS